MKKNPAPSKVRAEAFDLLLKQLAVNNRGVVSVVAESIRHLKFPEATPTPPRQE